MYAFYPNGTVRWSYNTGPAIYSTPAIDSDGTIYGESNARNLYAVNPNGTLKWEYTTGESMMGSPAIGSDGTIYVGSTAGNLFAFYPDGTLRWTFSAANAFYGSPAIGPDGTIYAGSTDQNLYAVNPDGTIKWNYTTGASIYGTPSIAADGTIYVGYDDSKLYAVNPDGTIKWNYTTGTSIYGAPAIAADGTIYIGGYDSNLYAINPDGTLKWTYDADDKFYTTPTVGSDGTVYIGDCSGKIYAINSDGTLKWEYTTDASIYNQAAIGSDGTLYVGSYDKKLYAFRDVADFNAGPKMGDVPLTVQFTDKSSGSPTSWSWDFGDGNDTNSTVQNPVHVYTEPGLYNVTLTTTYASGNSYSEEKTDYINVTSGGSGATAPIPSFTTDASSGYVPFTVQFTDTTTGNVSSLSWDFGDGGNSTEQNPVYTYLTEGTYTVTLTATGPGGTDTATSTMEVAAPLNTGSYDGGSPLLTVQEGNVSGGLWHDSWPGFSTYAEKTFTLPNHTEIKWAMLYLDVYCGNMEEKRSFSATIDIDADGDGVYELQENEAYSTSYSGTPVWLNDHVNRVTSDYFMWYDLTDNITGNEVNVKATGGGYDGRIKHVTLIVAYDDGDEDEIHYWVNQGHDTANPGYTGSTVFGTSALSDPGSVNLSSIYCASVNGAYTFNAASLSSGGPQGDYFGYDDWNVTELFNSGQDSTLTYAPTGSYYKIQLALLTASGAVSSNAPGADFTANVTSGGIPLTVSFTDESTGSPSSWLWDFGDGNNSTEQNPVHTYFTEGTYSVNLTVTNGDGSDSELKTDYITVTQAGQVATNDLSISGLVNTVTASAVFARETNPVKVLNVQNTGTATLTNISIAVYASDVSSGTVPVNTTTIESLAGDAKTTVTLIDPTIRDLEGGTVTYTAVVDPDNLIAETDETNNNKSSAAKNVRYNGYKGKGIYWEGGSNITTMHTFDLQGNLLYSTQPDSAYQPVGWESRTETWTASDLPVPDGSTIEKAFLYVAYNWDQTPGGYPWLNINFNGNTLDNGNISTGNGTLYRDWSNFGAYADYEYGLCVYDVTDKFSSAGNSLVMTPVGENKNALYPSTLVVIYGNDNETRKQIFINEECDELAYSETSYGTTPEEATAYAPFTGMSINVSNVQNATLHSFAGSAGPDEGNLLFNGNIVASNAWQGSSNSGSPLVFDATNYINATGNVAGIQSTTSGGMDALQQIFVIEYQADTPNLPTADFSATPTSGDSPLTVQFTDESTGSPTSWAWDFDNDGTVDSTDQNPSHEYTVEGTYTVTLTATNAYGNDTETKTGYILVTNLTNPNRFTNPGFETGDFTGWTTGSTTSISTSKIHSGAYGTHLDMSGTQDTNFVQQSVDLTNVASFSFWGYGESTTRTYYVYIDDVLVAQPAATPNVWTQYTIPTNYSGVHTVAVKWIGSYSFGADIDDFSMNCVYANFTATPTLGIAPLTVQFTDKSSGSPISWSWDFGDGDDTNSTVQNPVHVYAEPGLYNVILTTTYVSGNSYSEEKTDYINVTSGGSGGDVPVAAFTADPISGTVPLTVQFTDNSTGSPTSWFWDFGDGATSNESSPIHTYSAAGNYTVNLTVENTAGTDFELKTDYIEVSEASGSTVTLYFDPESSSVSENESTEISIVASNFPTGLSGYNLTVAIDDPAVAEIVDIKYPTWALITENSSLPGTSIYLKTVDGGDVVKEGAAGVVLAILTVSGKEKGSANLSIGVKRLEDDSGDSIESALLTGTIEVTLLSPLPDQEYAPKDLDGDGLYEDLTGNGEFSFVDIVAYFHNMDWIEENMPVEYFDFNGNGRIDFDDVVDMFAMI
ncbi:cell surface protein [Methanosarcina siciliae HI350]|uniref:Cell surface protein n=1 Tax=Methanosarcina siciliae HI350 TaxID=1434119 RepID=A0A0E3PFX9_9EURY|nr:cell surface protein [Methanosarcina siciliae HI350]